MIDQVEGLPPLDQVKLVDVPHCNLCGCNEQDWVHTASHLSSIVSGGRYDAVLCRGCGLLYLSKTLPPEVLETPGKHGGSLLYGLPADRATRRAYFARQLDKGRKASLWIEQQSGPLKAKRCLDLLSGCGGIVAALRERGADAEGLDPSVLLTQHGIEEGLVLHQSTIEAFEPDGPYDLITGVQLLNHFIDPKRLLSRMREWLKPDGVVYTETQDFFHAVRRKPMRSCLHVDHPVMFRPKSIRDYFHASEFGVESMECDRDRRHDFGSTNHMHLICRVDPSQSFRPDPAEVDRSRLELLLSLSQFQADHANRHSRLGLPKQRRLQRIGRLLSALSPRKRAA